jgi:hypothetical protein
MDRVEFRQEHDAFLLVRIGAGDDRGRRLGLAQIVRQVRHVGGNVDEVALAVDHVLLEPFTVPHADVAAQHVDGGFMLFVLVRLRPRAGRDRHELHMDGGGADCLGRDRRGVGKALLADEGLARLEAGAVLRPILRFAHTHHRLARFRAIGHGGEDVHVCILVRALQRFAGFLPNASITVAGRST